MFYTIAFVIFCYISLRKLYNALPDKLLFHIESHEEYGFYLPKQEIFLYYKLRRILISEYTHFIGFCNKVPQITWFKTIENLSVHKFGDQIKIKRWAWSYSLWWFWRNSFLPIPIFWFILVSLDVSWLIYASLQSLLHSFLCLSVSVFKFIFLIRTLALLD